MTETYKILAQTNAKDGTQARVVYTVPSNTQTSISSIAAINTGSTAQEVAFGIVKSADVAGSVEEGVLSAREYVTVSDGTTAAYSDDGITWTQTTMPSSRNWRAVTYGNGRYVAVAYDSSVAAYSDNGTTWTQTTLPSSQNWKSATYGDGKYVAISSQNAAAYSEDGINWTQTTMPSTGWKSATYGNGKYVAISGSVPAYSSDGITWTQTTFPASENWQSVTYGDGRYVAVAYNSDAAAYSDDGITWIATTISQGFWDAVVYGGGRYVTFSDASTNGAYSDDGINWTAFTTFGSVVPAGISSSHGDGRYVFVTNYYGFENDLSGYSDDGITWTETTLPSVQNWRSLTAKEELVTLNTLSNTQTIVPVKEIPAGTTEEFTGGITLSAGDQIRVYSEDEDISVHVYGVEIS